MVPQFVSQLFEPNPQLVLDEGRRKLDAKRNQTHFCVFFGSVILYPFLVPFTNFTFETHVANVVINITQTVLFLLLCRSYLWVFHLQYTIFISLAPIGLMLQVDELFFFHQGYAFIIPPFIFLMSNSLVLLSIAGGMQIVIFQTVFKTLFIKNIEEMEPALFAEKFIRGTIVPFVFLVVFLAVILQSLQKKTILLYEANKVAEETLEQQKTFILSFSHELRNPLNSLLGNLQLVLMSHITNECHEMIKTAQICGELLLQYINNLLDTGKFEIGKLEVAPAPIDPYALFQRIWTISYEIIKKKNLSGQLKIARKVPSMLLLDSQKVTQILLNLIGNAVKFTDRGSITVTVEWIDNSKVCDRSFEPIPYDETDEGLYEKQENFSRLSLLNETSGGEQYFILNNEKKKLKLDEVVRPNIRQEGVLKIIVKDTGGGMKKEALKQLFNKFSQVSEDPLKRQIGTGLGLFITRELCKKMNGDIRVYSREKVGSVFTVCIPTYSAPPIRKQADSTASICRTLKEKCRKAIVADDSPFNVSLLCNYFSKLGVIVVGTADNGYDALRKYIDCMERGEPVDIVTLDIDMPKMNGKVACKKIRQYESNFRMAGTNIVMISGNYDETQVKECLDRDGEWKVSYFLKKPLAFEDFSSIVYQLLLRDRSH